MKGRRGIGNGYTVDLCIFIFMNDCGADNDNKQMIGIKSIDLFVLI